MGLSCFGAISGMDWVGWDLCAGLFYEHRFAMLKIKIQNAPNYVHVAVMQQILGRVKCPFKHIWLTCGLLL